MKKIGKKWQMKAGETRADIFEKIGGSGGGARRISRSKPKVNKDAPPKPKKDLTVDELSSHKGGYQSMTSNSKIARERGSMVLTPKSLAKRRAKQRRKDIKEKERVDKEKSTTEKKGRVDRYKRDKELEGKLGKKGLDEAKKAYEAHKKKLYGGWL
jgi:hypothetical protein